MSPSLFSRSILCLVLIVAVTVFAQPKTAQTPIPTPVPGQNAILMGAAWYPE
jgi:hypothetical protein